MMKEGKGRQVKARQGKGRKGRKQNGTEWRKEASREGNRYMKQAR